MQSEKGRHGWEVGEGREPKKFGIWSVTTLLPCTSTFCTAFEQRAAFTSEMGKAATARASMQVVQTANPAATPFAASVFVCMSYRGSYGFIRGFRIVWCDARTKELPASAKAGIGQRASRSIVVVTTPCICFLRPSDKGTGKAISTSPKGVWQALPAQAGPLGVSYRCYATYIPVSIASYNTSIYMY